MLFWRTETVNFTLELHGLEMHDHRVSSVGWLGRIVPVTMETVGEGCDVCYQMTVLCRVRWELYGLDNDTLAHTGGTRFAP
jgi:hypothetical protein